MRISDWSSDVCSSDLPKVPSEDIAYKDGQMSFLGIPVAQGGVTQSTLDTSGAPVELPVEPKPAKVKKPAKPRATKATKAKARSEEHTSELQSLMRISYAVFCLKKKKIKVTRITHTR